MELSTSAATSSATTTTDEKLFPSIRSLSILGGLFCVLCLLNISPLHALQSETCPTRIPWRVRGLPQARHSLSPRHAQFTDIRTALFGADEALNEYDDEEEWIQDDKKYIYVESSDFTVNGEMNGEEGPTLQTLSRQISETQNQLLQQQEQIHQILQLLQPGSLPDSRTVDDTPGTSTILRQYASNSISTISNGTASITAPLVPLRVMVFVDGTWLYYSLFKRDIRCPINQRYGFGWHNQYRFDWAALPRIICGALQKPDPGWRSSLTENGPQSRPLEITRISVFTSYKAGTAEVSLRYRLFQDMRAAGYDVHQMETVGKSEKCVDIQLAVEMLHYATVPNAYDIAVLLSGDKDFLPALVRVRQKGRKTAIVSMKSGCNQALVETKGIKDYDMVWIEDYLDDLIVPIESKSSESGGKYEKTLHSFIYVRLVWEFIVNSDRPAVSSRDVGRYLKSLVYEGRSLLDEIKSQFGGLLSFLVGSSAFNIQGAPEGLYLLSIKEDRDMLIQAQKRANLSEEDLEQLDRFLQSTPVDKQTAYYFTYYDVNHKTTKMRQKAFVPEVEVVARDVPDDLKVDYSKFTVAQLKEQCKERGLSSSGLKAALLERVHADIEAQTSKVKSSSLSSNVQEVADYIKQLLKEYLHASGGKASSRDIGRYLAANKRKRAGSSELVSASQELKVHFGGLWAYASLNSDVFHVEHNFADGTDEYAKYAFELQLKTQS